ncbi:FkbM family methyltransferase [Maritimibacter fusiformis]|uniref:FkbM family methyltransferase n=1 Tax=Maritimibacter fusiformis TaxID=2603819 RepID=A0A5D0RIQ6_9RHOB|nr:FkbM family methyltransferase [Maritimibacter fusiformis]
MPRRGQSGGKVASFELDGIKLRVPGHALNDSLRRALESGKYEWNESAAIRRHAKPGDKVLDIGAGAGYVSALAARAVGGDNVVAVEASPVMLEVLRQNLDGNGAAAAQLIHGAVVDDRFDADTVSFLVRDAFWASTIAGADAPRDKLAEVPALRLSALLEEHQPSVVIMDVEGGELQLSQQAWPDCVRLVIMEIHTMVYPPSGVRAIFDGMSRNDMTYMPWGTQGEVVVFQRVHE